MKAMVQDRWFIWTLVGIVVIGVSTWAYAQYTIIQMEADTFQWAGNASGKSASRR
jgi:hypothetical protein